MALFIFLHYHHHHTIIKNSVLYLLRQIQNHHHTFFLQMPFYPSPHVYKNFRTAITSAWNVLYNQQSHGLYIYKLIFLSCKSCMWQVRRPITFTTETNG